MRRPSGRSVAWLLTRNSAALSADESTMIEKLLAACPEIAAARKLAMQFVEMVRGRHADALDPWIAAATASASPRDLQGFARGLQADLAAVRATLEQRSNRRPHPPAQGPETADVRVSQLRLAANSCAERCQTSPQWRLIRLRWHVIVQIAAEPPISPSNKASSTVLSHVGFTKNKEDPLWMHGDRATIEEVEFSLADSLAKPDEIDGSVLNNWSFSTGPNITRDQTAVILNTLGTRQGRTRTIEV